MTAINDKNNVQNDEKTLEMNKIIELFIQKASEKTYKKNTIPGALLTTNQRQAMKGETFNTEKGRIRHQTEECFTGSRLCRF